MAVRTFTPIEYQQETKQHTSDIGHMSHTITYAAHSRDELDDSINSYEPLCLNGNRQGEDKDALIGESHTKSQQDTIDGTRGSDGT